MRSLIGQKTLRGLAVLSIEAGKANKIDNTVVIKRFAKSKARQAPFKPAAE